jgi:hypothetical protein
MAEATEKGVDFLRYADNTWWLVLSADYFRHHYPGGLEDALVVFDGCKTAGSDMADALEGRNSNYVGWNAGVSPQGSADVMEALFARLAQGRAIHEVYESMGSDVRDKWSLTGATLQVGALNVRIRELPRAIDAFTGDTLTSNGNVEVDGYTDDGIPDSLLVVLEFEGIPAADAAASVVRLFVDGVEFAAGPLPEFAGPDGDYRWTGTGEVALGYDAKEGQRVDIELTIDLPEGGKSIFKASPAIATKKFWPGRKWQGTFSKVTDLGFATVLLDVDATFVRDPDESATTQHPTFVLQSGTMHWSLVDGGGDDCIWMAPSMTTELGPNALDQFTFDLTKEPVEYRGGADSAGPRVELTVSCSDGSDPPVTTIEAGGSWFIAPSDQHYVASESAIGGFYSGNAVSHNTWNVTKVE